MKKAWRLVCIDSFLLAFGVIVIGLVTALPKMQMSAFIFKLGSLVRIAGGFFLLLGSKVQYSAIHLKLSYDKINGKGGRTWFDFLHFLARLKSEVNFLLG